MNSTKRWWMNKRVISLPLVLLAIGLLPAISGDPANVGRYISVLIAIGMVISLRLLVVTGQFSMGHAGFMAVGAYTSAILTTRYDFPIWASMPLAGMLGAVTALAIGIPTLRLKGLYFAVVTFMLAEIIRMITFNWEMLGGHQGLSRIPSPELAGIDFHASRIPFFYLIFGITCVILAVCYRLDRTLLGNASRAVHEDSTLAESIGIDTFRIKMIAFVLGGFFAGVIGSFYAHYYGYLHGDSFAIWKSVFYIICLQLGGVGSIWGGIIGATVLTSLPEVFRFSLEYEPLLYGGFVVVAMLFLPGGLLTLPSRLTAAYYKLNAMRKKGADGNEST